MEQNAVPGAMPAPVVERTGKVRPAVWLKFHQVKGAKEILERTGRLPGVLRFGAHQTVSAFRIPEGQSYRVILPDGRKLVMTEGVQEIAPPVEANPGDEIRFRFLEARRTTSPTLPTEGELEAHLDTVWSDPLSADEPIVPAGLDTVWSDPTFADEPVVPTGKAMTAVEESIGELEDGALELIEDTASAGKEFVPTSSTASPRPAQIPTISLGNRAERHPSVFSRFLRTFNREGSR